MSLLTHPGAASAAVLPVAPAPARAALALSHMPMVMRGLAPLRLTDAAQPITIDFALKPRNAGQIPALLQAISDPKSQMYGHYLTQAEYRAKFAPTQAQVDQVVAYAKPQGLTVGHVSPSRMLVHATDTAAQMNAAFGVTLHDYVSPDSRDNGRIFHSPTSEPTIDASIAPLLTGVVASATPPCRTTTFTSPLQPQPLLTPAISAPLAPPTAMSLIHRCRRTRGRDRYWA